jgi:WD40 repeat protein
VLTAAHVVAGAVSVTVRDPGKVRSEAALDPRFVGDTDGPGPDLALVEITDPGTGVPPMGLAAVDRDTVSADPVEGCHVVGYPVFRERDAPGGGRFRETADAFGHVPVLSGLAGGLLSVQVSSMPRPLPPAPKALQDSEWSGISGGPVVAGGLLLGVVTEHAPREGPSAITATPLTALEADPAHPGWGSGVPNPGEWWARLGVSGLENLRRLPAPRTRPGPAYLATLREIHGRTPQLVGRGEELAELAGFATGTEGYRWLKGAAWAGKTALIAEAVTAALPPSADVVVYFLSRREADADSNRFLAAVVPQLAYLLDEEPPVPGLHQFRDLWLRAGEHATESGRHLLLVVDGLDEDLRPPGVPSVASVLPVRAGGRVHVLVTSRPGLDPDFPAGHPLRTIPAEMLRPFAGATQVAELARQEIDDLLQGPDQDLAAEVLGVLTSAAGPLAIDDLAALTSDLATVTPAWARQVDRLVTQKAARSLQSSGLSGHRRYQFAHGSLLEQAQTEESLRILRHPDYLRRIDRWADHWRDAGWPVPAGEAGTTPQYLLSEYLSTLIERPQKLAALVSDVGWVAAAVHASGVDQVLADLGTAQSAGPGLATVSALLGTLRAQAPNLRPRQAVHYADYVLRQLCLQLAEFGENSLADDARARLRALDGPRLVPLWTTRRASRALAAEVGRHDSYIRAVAVLPDGRVASGDSDGRVLLWDPAAPGADPVELSRRERPIDSLAVLADGRLVIGGYDGKVHIRDPAAPGADPVELGGHSWYVQTLAVLADGRVVSGGGDGQARIWDPGAKDAAPVELGGHPRWVAVVAVLADGRVVTGGDDGVLRIWEPAAPGVDPVVLAGHDGHVKALAVLGDGRLISGGSDGRVLLWDPAAPEVGPVELGSHDGHVETLAPLADGRVASGGSDARLHIWDPATPDAGPVEVGGHDGWVAAVALLPDGRVVSGGGDGRIRIWDPGILAAGHVERGSDDRDVLSLVALADGRVVSGGKDGRVLLWDPAAPGSGPVMLGGHNRRVVALALLPDGRVVSAGGDGDGQVRVWDPAAPGGGPIELGNHARHAVALAVLPDGRVVSGGWDKRVLLWDPAAPGPGPAELCRIDGNEEALAVLSDGRVITGGILEPVRIWDPAAPAAGPVELAERHAWAEALAVLPDGRVVTGGIDGRMRVWDPGTPAAGPVELGSHGGWITAMVVLPSGLVVTGDQYGEVRVWDVARTGEIARADSSVTAMAVVPATGPDEHVLMAHEGQGLSMWVVSHQAAGGQPA